MFKRFFFVCVLLVAVALRLPAADQRVTLTITVTNLPVTSNTLVFTAPASKTITWTNVAGNANVITGATVAASTTNLFLNLAAYGIGTPRLQLIASSLTTNSFDLIGAVNQNIAVSSAGTGAGNWATLTLSTSTVTRLTTVRVPIASEVGDTNRTNVGSLLVVGISDYSTNAFSQTATAVSQLVGTTNSQSVSNKAFYDSTIDGYGLLGESNTWTATNWFDHLVVDGAIVIGTNDPPIFPSVGLAINGRAPSAYLDGYSETASQAPLIFLQRARGSAVGTPSNVLSSDVLGKFEILGYAGSSYRTAFQLIVTATTNWTASTSNTRIDVKAAHPTAAGPQPTVISITDTNIVLTNIYAHTLVTPEATVTDLTVNGSLVGEWAYESIAVSSLANGNNIAVPGTNFLIEGSGPTAAYTINGITGGRAGREIVILNRAQQTVTLANESGVDPTAANRIWTPGYTDITVQSNGWVELVYNGTDSRWRVKNAYPPVAVSTNTIGIGSATEVTYNNAGVSDGASGVTIGAETNLAVTGLISAGKLNVSTVITQANVTASRVAIYNANKEMTNSAAVDTTELEYLDGVTSAVQTQIDSKHGYTLSGGNALTLSVADATIYYFGNNASGSTTYTDTRIYVPKSGTVKGWLFRASVSAVGSAETASHYLRLNDTTDFGQIDVTLNAATVEGAVTGLGQAVVAGDFISPKLAAQTYATNPGGRYQFIIYIE